MSLALRATELALSGGAIPIAEAAIDEAERTTTARTEPAVKVRIALARARVAARRERWEDAASSLAQVTDAIDTLSDEGLRGEALLTLGRVEMEAGRPEAAAGILERAIETLEQASEDELSGVARARASTTPTTPCPRRSPSPLAWAAAGSGIAPWRRWERSPRRADR